MFLLHISSSTHHITSSSWNHTRYTSHFHSLFMHISHPTDITCSLDLHTSHPLCTHHILQTSVTLLVLPQITPSSHHMFLLTHHIFPLHITSQCSSSSNHTLNTKAHITSSIPPNVTHSSSSYPPHLTILYLYWTNMWLFLSPTHHSWITWQEVTW